MQTSHSEDFMVIDFRANGTVEAMHRDKFPLDFLGKQAIKRASDIRFDEQAQLWDIHLAVDDKFVEVGTAKGFATYDEARKMEVRWLEMARLHDLDPMSEGGLNLLAVLRKKFD